MSGWSGSSTKRRALVFVFLRCCRLFVFGAVGVLRLRALLHDVAPVRCTVRFVGRAIGAERGGDAVAFSAVLARVDDLLDLRRFVPLGRRQFVCKFNAAFQAQLRRIPGRLDPGAGKLFPQVLVDLANVFPRTCQDVVDAWRVLRGFGGRCRWRNGLRFGDGRRAPCCNSGWLANLRTGEALARLRRLGRFGRRFDTPRRLDIYPLNGFRIFVLGVHRRLVQVPQCQHQQVQCYGGTHARGALAGLKIRELWRHRRIINGAPLNLAIVAKGAWSGARGSAGRSFPCLLRLPLGFAGGGA